MDNRFTPLEGDEVLSVDESVQILIGHRTFRASELMSALKQHLIQQQVGGITADKDGWLSTEGVSCEALRFGANRWLKGKVRISLEFCPDESAGDLSSFTATAAPTIDIPADPEGSAFVDDGLGDILTEADLPIAETPAPEPEPEPEVAIAPESEPINLDEDDFFSSDVEGELEAPAADTSDDLFATDDGADVEDIFDEAPVDLSQDDAVAADLFPNDVDGADDIFAEAPVDLSDEETAEDLFGDVEEAEENVDDLFGDTSDGDSEEDFFGGLEDSGAEEDLFGESETPAATATTAAEADPFTDDSNPFADDPFGETEAGDDDGSELFGDAEDIFADAPTEMPAPITDDDLGGDDLFADAEEPADTTSVADDEDIFALEGDDLFGDSSEGELDTGNNAASELSVEDADDIFGTDDNDDAIDWGLDDGDDLSLDTGDTSASSEEEDDSVFADIWSDIDDLG